MEGLTKSERFVFRVRMISYPLNKYPMQSEAFVFIHNLSNALHIDKPIEYTYPIYRESQYISNPNPQLKEKKKYHVASIEAHPFTELQISIKLN